ncbi:MAG: DegT/DnrJ/EryC1/StrS family aminotransferase [Acidobacteria bacterium]|nr:DegT/DnrJ/EryC1/StrS family aminotransferase [Acidobacteriota bacterium]
MTATTTSPSALADAKFGAAAFSRGTEELPGVFPREMGANTMRYLKEVHDSGLASDMVTRFEKAFAAYHGVKHAIGTPGCTQAIFAGALALDFAPGDEVIFSPIADYGTVAGFLLRDLVPVFADTEPGSPLVSAETIRPRITDRTRAIVVVHKMGLPCDMNPILELARRHNLLVIEDVCQAILARYNGRLAGTFGDLAMFSLDSEKTCGADMGGVVMTNRDDLADKIRNRAIARGAKNAPGFGRAHFFPGFALRMPQCTAATCLGQFEILPRQIQQRQQTAALLDRLIADIPGLRVNPVPADRTHSYWLYGFNLDPKAFSCTVDEFAGQLTQAGIPDAGTGRYYLMSDALPFLTPMVERGEYPFSTPPASRRYRYGGDETPNAKAFLDTWVRWFWTEKYTRRHIETIASIIRNVCARNH